MERYLRTSGAVTREIAGETLIVPVRHHVADLEAIFCLNSTGGHLWAQLDQSRTAAELAESLAREFAVSSEQADRDTRLFLQELAAANLVHLQPGGVGG